MEGKAEHEEESQKATEKEIALEIILGDISSGLVVTEPVWAPLPSLFNQQKIESSCYSNKTVTLIVMTTISYSIFHLVRYLASTVKYILNPLTFLSKIAYMAVFCTSNFHHPS